MIRGNYAKNIDGGGTPFIASWTWLPADWLFGVRPHPWQI
jgi:hypothetical protein